MLPRSLRGVNDLFAPPGNDWQPVSPALARLRRTVLVAVGAVLLVVVVVVGLMMLPAWVWLAAVVVVVGAAGFGWVVIGRNARWWGYAERDEDLYIKHGALFRTYRRVRWNRPSRWPVSTCTPRARVPAPGSRGCRRPRRPGCGTG
jgi:hypothetical protein